MRKKIVKLICLYFGMLFLFAFRYYLTTEIKTYEMYNYTSEAIWLWYLRNAIDVLYYILEILLLLALCQTEKTYLILEALLLMPVALIACLAGTIIINPFAWIFTNSEYCIPFGAMICCALLYRWSIRYPKDK